MYDEQEYNTKQPAKSSEKSRDFDSNMFDSDPVRYSTEIDSKLIQSGYKENEFKAKIPIFKEVSFGIPYLNKQGKMRLVNGKPVLKTIKKLKYFTGEYLEKPFPLPVDLHNDSVTSSILEPGELSIVRMIDAFDTELCLEYISNPDVDFSTSIPFFAEIKASIIDSSKGKGGRMAELAKTTINKGEQRSWDYNQQRELDEFNNRKSKRGLFGLGFFGL